MMDFLIMSVITNWIFPAPQEVKFEMNWQEDEF